MRIADNRGLGHFWMCHQGRFNFGCSHPVAGYIQHIINTAGDPKIAILITAGTVTGEIATREGGKIGFDESLMVAIDGSHLAGP